MNKSLKSVQLKENAIKSEPTYNKSNMTIGQSTDSNQSVHLHFLIILVTSGP